MSKPQYLTLTDEVINWNPLELFDEGYKPGQKLKLLATLDSKPEDNPNGEFIATEIGWILVPNIV